MLDFKCSRCGYCCTHLLTSRGDLTYGLYLSPSEAKYFPKEVVFPLFKNGDNIFAYQLGMDICPHFNENKCLIYENRPLGCKAFPLKSLTEVETDFCTFTKEHKGEKWNLLSLKKEQEAVQQQYDELEELPQATEMYIMKYKKWVDYDRFKEILQTVS